MTLYFEHVDTASHRYGVDADETRAAIRRVDAHLARLLAGTRKLPIAAAHCTYKGPYVSDAAVGAS